MASLSVGTTFSVFLSLMAAGVLVGVRWGEVRVPLALMAQQCVGSYGHILLVVVGLVFIPLALNSTILLVIRQARVMGQDSLFPGSWREEGGEVRASRVLLLLTGLGPVFFILVGNLELIARLGGFCALATMSTIAVADLVRQRGLEGSPSPF